MNRRDFIRNSAMAAVVLSHFSCQGTSYQKIIQKAGNMPDHGMRFILLSGLKDSGKVPDEYLGDLDCVIQYAQTWAFNSATAEHIEDDKWRKLYLNHYYTRKIRRKELNPDIVNEVPEADRKSVV